jgi:hypothetical protein
MHERIESMGHALRTALAGKEQWRHRALEAEKQLAKLRGQIQATAEGAQAQAQAGAHKAQRGGPLRCAPGGWKQADEA